MHTNPPNKQMEIDRSNCPSTNSDRDIQASTSGDISASSFSEVEKTVEPPRSKPNEANDISFEALLLRTVKNSTNSTQQIEKPKTKVCDGAEVVTSNEVIQRLKEKDESLNKPKTKMRKPYVDEVREDPGLIENDDSSRKRVNRKRKTTDEWSSSSEEDNTILTESEEEFSNDIAEDIQSEQDDWQNLGENVSDMNIDDWVLVKFPGKKSIKHYVG
ncbi:hypothetical protein JTB14_037138 [Gonioctena quinquepunctata]|nr:hypothetical protein JTB14_037138 [Gonioctena quinquepunctata]